MKKYIDADRLKAEIDRRMTDNLKADSEIHSTAYFAGAAKEDYDILSIIDSFQQEQPEADIKKELYSYIRSDAYMNTREDGSLLIAKYFYELGLNARKED
jgi:hypothetical protein